jgi:exodeoxyribonuclease VII large subunit
LVFNCSIRCALFRLNQRNIKFNPENGMEILLHAAPTLYEARGDFQLIVRHLEPVGVGKTSRDIVFNR